MEADDRHFAQTLRLSETEPHQLLSAWNATQTLYSEEHTLTELFAQCTRTYSEAIAIGYEDAQLSYGELEQRSNQLAHYLQDIGVGSETVVRICLERSLELVIGLLGVLKAGGAYVPLDPSYPAKRLAYMLMDTQAPVVLTQQALCNRVPEYRGHVICLDSAWKVVEREPRSEVHQQTSAQALAYVIYTSGSTGQPKGAMNTHAGICNRLQWMQAAYPLNLSDRVLQKTTFNFDVSVWEFFWPLFSGARLVLARPEGHKDSAYLVELIQQQQITTLHFVPSMLQLFLEEPGAEECESIQRVFCSGEALSFALQTRFFERFSASLHNLYGPTETAVDVSSWDCDPRSHPGIVPIGRPISNTKLYILDTQDQPVPIGQTGELSIGGIGVGRGYFNRPELTAEKFVPNPFGTQAGERLYRTGDLVCYLPDGNIKYIGRLDQQVKLRGLRIELEEIEQALLQQSEVQNAVVVVRQNSLDDKRLVAYIVPATEESTHNVDAATAANALSTIVFPLCFHDRRNTLPSGNVSMTRYTRSWSRAGIPTFDTRGWNSSYTGQSITAVEMRSWLEDTLSGLRRLCPQRVLEIGCGTGMLLFQSAPGCICYDGSDFSEKSLAYVQHVIEQEPEQYGKVRLWLRQANEFEGWKQESYDLVILNSVVQYFPDVSYLMEVLQGALRLLAPGGTLFVGDVRSLPLQEHFYLAVQLARGSDKISWQQVRQRVRQEILLEKELLIDPALFVQLGLEEEIEQVHILPKQGKYHNELTQFRYQVFMRKRQLEETEEKDSRFTGETGI